MASLDQIGNIRRINDERFTKQTQETRHKELLQSNTHVQNALTYLIEYLGRKDSADEAKAIKDNLSALHEQLKQLLHATKRSDEIKVSNLKSLETGMRDLTKVVKAQKVDPPVVNVPEAVVNIPAPVVNVPAPVVNVPKAVVNVPAPIVNVKAPVVKVDKPDLTSINKELKEVTKAVKTVKPPAVVKTETTNTLLTEKFDEYRLVYDDFDESAEKTVEAIVYYYKNKKVARINYKYDDDGNLISGKKS